MRVREIREIHHSPIQHEKWRRRAREAKAINWRWTLSLTLSYAWFLAMLCLFEGVLW